MGSETVDDIFKPSFNDSEEDQAEEDSFSEAFDDLDDFELVDCAEDSVDFADLTEAFDFVDLTEAFDFVELTELIELFDDMEDCDPSLVLLARLETVDFDVFDSAELFVSTELPVSTEVTDSLDEEDMMLIDSLEEDEDETIDTSSLLISTGLL